MEKIIKLNEIENGNNLLINVVVSQIVTFGQSYQDHHYSTIRLIGGYIIKVKQTPAEIEALIKNLI
ncbi:MAG: hypothetical protein V4520_18675 [Bacteroidota bacterium]